MDVEVDGAPLGQTTAQPYLYRELIPGKHTITSRAENTDTLNVDAQPEQLSCIWQEVKMGILFARTKLHLVDGREGPGGVMGIRLAEGLDVSFDVSSPFGRQTLKVAPEPEHQAPDHGNAVSAGQQKLSNNGVIRIQVPPCGDLHRINRAPTIDKALSAGCAREREP